jgi:lipopolysaccharide/colanic/teichoic acid biosynthesis glycosyltransferase
MVVQGLTRPRPLSALQPTFAAQAGTRSSGHARPHSSALPVTPLPPRAEPRRLPLHRTVEAEVRRHVHRQPRGYLMARRVLDVVVAAVVGLLVLPLIPVLAVLITLESPGSAIYRQVRLGAHGRPFHIYKLRSMTADAESSGQPRWASEEDPRITLVGRFLRRTRLDELPQLWNVLRGDMSLIGPRPERPEFVEHLERAHPGFHLRLMVRPGLTGWAQVRHRYTSSIEEARVKLEYDLYYLTHAGPRLDLEVLVRTAGVVIGMKGR